MSWGVEGVEEEEGKLERHDLPPSSSSCGCEVEDQSCNYLLKELADMYILCLVVSELVLPSSSTQ